MTGQRNIIEENHTTFKGSIVKNTNVALLNHNPMESDKDNRNQQKEINPRIGFVENTDYPQTDDYEIEVEIRLENFNSYCKRAGIRNRSTGRISSTSAASSNESARLSATSGVEHNNNNKHQSKYSSQQIAKILRTKERMRRLLYMPPESPTEVFPFSCESLQSPTATKEKSPMLSKLSSQYFTLSNAWPKQRKSSFRSLPTPSGRAKDPFSPRNALTLKRAKSEICQPVIRHLVSESDLLSLNTLAETKQAENSSNEFSYYNENILLGDHRKNLSRNRNNSLCQSSLSPVMASRGLIDLKKNDNGLTLNFNTLSSKTTSRLPVTPEDDRAKNTFSTLKRRFSKKSKPRSKSLSRRSLGADELLDTRREVKTPLLSPKSATLKFSSSSFGHKSSNKENFAKNHDVSMVQPQEEKCSPNQFKQMLSIKERFTSLVGKTSPALTRGRKSSIRKQNDYESPKSNLTKNLSSSSPQLSVHRIKKL